MFIQIQGHLEVVKLLIQNNADIHANNNKALRNASRYGNFNFISFKLRSLGNCKIIDSK